MGYSIKIDSILQDWDMYGEESFNEEKISDLETFLLDCNSSMRDGKELVEDSIYDSLTDILRQVKPESGILKQLWEDDGDVTDYTELLRVNPMMSIQTAKSWGSDEVKDFIDRCPDVSDYFASYKINGHGIRVVYKDGILVSATSRARASAGRDLTRQMKLILGEEKESLSGYGLVEIRGELCLKEELLESARSYNPTIKSAFSAVSSMSRDSASDDEIKLLDLLCYGFLSQDISFDTREEEFSFLGSVGFEVPEFTLMEEINKEQLLEYMQGCIEAFEENYEEFGYFCDGVVFEVNDRQLFRDLGSEGKYNKGNIALKVGVWEQSMYTGTIERIEWTRGKNKLSPVAIVEDENGEGVLTAQGNRVRRVPLYEPRNILILDAYVGEPIHFKYGGEAGVVPCFMDGRLLSEEVAKEILIN